MHVACLGDRRGIYRVLVVKPEGRPRGRTRRRWENNIKLDLQKVECGGMNWMNEAEDGDMCWALVSVLMNL